MQAIITGIAVHILVALLAVSNALAQQSSASATPVTNVSASPSGLTIKQDFLAQQVAAIRIDIRAAQRCVKVANLTLYDVEGNINRVAQTDLVNCGRRLIQLQEALAKLGVASAKAAEDAAAEAEILAGLLKQKEMLQSVSETMTRLRRRW